MTATFPSGFLWGAATSAHQVEGKCTNNQWWAWEQDPGHIRDGDVSGVACDHYRRFDDDFRLAAELGHTAHRFSIEWSRIEPDEGRFDERELDHYRAVCDSVRRHGMAPTVTLHHFTHPLWVARAGGWENPRIVDWLARFAERAGRALGERVAIWWTINEPMVAPVLSYMLGIHPPGVQDVGRALVVARQTLLSHGAMYRALRAVIPGAVPVGPVLNMMWFEPLDPGSPEDRAEVEQQDYFVNQWYLDGITTGRVQPPCGEGEEVPGLAGSFDVLGLNYYMRILVRAGVPSGPASLRRTISRVRAPCRSERRQAALRSRPSEKIRPAIPRHAPLHGGGRRSNRSSAQGQSDPPPRARSPGASHRTLGGHAARPVPRRASRPSPIAQRPRTVRDRG